MHYLVTGGAGFIGSHLTRKLVALGHEVTVLDDLSAGKKENLPSAVHFIQGDIQNAEDMNLALKQVSGGCFHLAAIPSVRRCIDEWELISRVNVMGTISVYEACRKQPKPVPVVYASSAATYGFGNGLLEEGVTAMQPTSSYGADKLACEFYAHIAWKNYGLPCVGLRFFNVYGPGQPKESAYSGVITCFMHAHEQGKPFTIYGDGSQTRDFIYVGDIADACIDAMQMKDMQDQVFNVGTGVATSVLDIATAMAKIYNKPLEIDFQDARVGDVQDSRASIKKMEAGLKKADAFLSLDEGLRLTLGS